MTIKTSDTLFIDLDGVLRIWPEDDGDLEERYGLPIGSIRQVAFEATLLQSAITGSISDEVWRHQVTATLQRLYPKGQVLEAVQAWSAPVGSINLPVYNFLCEEVVGKLSIYLVTNATTRLPTDLSLLGIAHLFDGIINSSDVGAAKPDPIIFHRALSIADTTAKRTLFIDDSLPNVEAVRELGIRSVHFQGEGELGSFLSGA